MLYLLKSCHSFPGGVNTASTSNGNNGNKRDEVDQDRAPPRKFFCISRRKIAPICRSQSAHENDL